MITTWPSYLVEQKTFGVHQKKKETKIKINELEIGSYMGDKYMNGGLVRCEENTKNVSISHIKTKNKRVGIHA